MKTDLQQTKKKSIIIEVTNNEWVSIKTASIYSNTKPSTVVKDILLQWAKKYQTTPPSKD